MSVFDRWLSLAKPLEYKHLIHVKNFNSVTAFTFTLILIFTVLKCALVSDMICIEQAYGFAVGGLGNIAALALTASEFTLINVFVVLICKHLMEMSKRSSILESDTLLKQAAKYVIVNYIWLHTCFLRSYVVLMLKIGEYYSFYKISLNFVYLSISNILINSCFGISNIIAFAYFTNAYIIAIKPVICIRSSMVAVSNENRISGVTGSDAPSVQKRCEDC